MRSKRKLIAIIAGAAVMLALVVWGIVAIAGRETGNPGGYEIQAGTEGVGETLQDPYPELLEPEDYESKFSLNFVSDVDMEETYTVELAVFGDITEEELRDQITVKSMTLGGVPEEYELTKLSNWRYIVSGKNGKWAAGEMHQIAIKDTGYVRFFKDGEFTTEKITFFNFSIAKEETNTLTISDGVIFINLAEVSGVEVGGGLFEFVAGSDGTELRMREVSGTMRYKGDLCKGDIIAVYDGDLDRETGIVDGDVRYIRITGGSAALGYSYESADFDDVIDIPEEFPIEDDGSFEDCMVTVKNSDLDFSDSRFAELGIDPDAVPEVGEYIWFYRGDVSDPISCETVGYGRIVLITPGRSTTVITYEPVLSEDIESQSEFYTNIDNLDIIISDEELETIEEGVVSDVMKSGFVEETETYLMALLTDREYDVESSKYAEELKNITFLTDKGDPVSLVELRQIAEKSKRVELADKPSIKFALTKTLDNLEGKGVRVVVECGFKIEIDIGSTGSTANKIEIKVSCAFEQEVVLGLSVKVGGTIARGYTISASLKPGIFTGFGACATIMTTSESKNEDTDWDKLVSATNTNLSTDQAEDLTKLGEKLENLDKALNTYQNGGSYSREKGEKKGKTSAGEDDDGAQYAGTGGDLQSKYSSMMDNDAEYVNLINQKIFKAGVRVDPAQLIEVSIEGDFVVGFKLNAMLGLSVSFENQKEYSYSINIKTKKGKTETVDVKTPCLRSDAYAFGMLGLRVGVLFDLRVGFLSTELDSAGVTAEAGIYFEVYGFVYASATWTPAEGFTASAQGSFLVEVGAYLEIKLLLQAGDGKVSFDKDIYSNQWPFWHIGDEEFPLDFVLEPDADELNIEFKEGWGTYKLPDEAFKIKLMDVKSGEVAEKNADADVPGDFAYSYTIGPKTFTQFKEQNFAVYLYDVDSAGKPNGKHSFLYDVETDNISVTPESNTIDELWGVMKLTFRTKTFGFNTKEISRTFKLHWKGTPKTALVSYIYVNEDGAEEIVGEGSFSGYSGTQTVYTLDEKLLRKYPAYTVTRVEFADESVLRAKKDTLAKLRDDAKLKYEKIGSNSQAEKDYFAASEAANAAWNEYNEFGMFGVNAVKSGSGPVMFTMNRDSTVVKLYCGRNMNEVRWLVMDDELTIKAVDSSNVILGGPFLETMPDQIADFMEKNPGNKVEWFVYDGSSDAIYKETVGNDIFSRVNGTIALEEALADRDAWTGLSESTLMGENYALAIGMWNIPQPFTVNWSDGESVFLSEEILYGTQLTPADAPKREGRFFSWYEDEEGNAVDPSKLKMADHELTFTAVYRPYTYQAHFSGAGFEVTKEIEYGSSIYDSVATYQYAIDADSRNKPGYTFRWFERKQDGTLGELGSGAVMPAHEMLMEGSFVPNVYKVTWIDNENTVEEELQIDQVIPMMPLERSEGDDCEWMMDGVIFTEGTKVPAHDVTITANHHKHEWALEKTIKPSTCVLHGTGIYVCEHCGREREMELPLDPENHSFSTVEYKERPTCSKEGLNIWTCSDCGETKEEIVPIDPDEHLYASRVLVEERAANCVRKGYSGDTVCGDCGEIIAYGYETPIDHSNHVFGVIVGAYTADCDSSGYTGDLMCGSCGALIRYGGIINPKGHNWGAPVYTWSADGHTCTATRTCRNKSSHVQTETVETVLVSGSSSCADYAERTYSATFTNTAFSAQQKKITGYGEHTWGETIGAPVVIYTESGGRNHYELHASPCHICSVCGAVEETSGTKVKFDPFVTNTNVVLSELGAEVAEAFFNPDSAACTVLSIADYCEARDNDGENYDDGFRGIGYVEGANRAPIRISVGSYYDCRPSVFGTPDFGKEYSLTWDFIFIGELSWASGQTPVTLNELISLDEDVVELKLHMRAVGNRGAYLDHGSSYEFDYTVDPSECLEKDITFRIINFHIG